MRTSERLHVLHGHAQHRQLVQLAGHGVAGGHQGGQLVDEAVHLVPAPLLDLAVRLSVEGEKPTDGESAILLADIQNPQKKKTEK